MTLPSLFTVFGYSGIIFQKTGGHGEEYLYTGTSGGNMKRFFIEYR